MALRKRGSSRSGRHSSKCSRRSCDTCLHGDMRARRWFATAITFGCLAVISLKSVTTTRMRRRWMPARLRLNQIHEYGGPLIPGTSTRMPKAPSTPPPRNSIDSFAPCERWRKSTQARRRVRVRVRVCVRNTIRKLRGQGRALARRSDPLTPRRFATLCDGRERGIRALTTMQTRLLGLDESLTIPIKSPTDCAEEPFFYDDYALARGRPVICDRTSALAKFCA